VESLFLFFAASKKGDSNALTSDSPFALCFFYSSGLLVVCIFYLFVLKVTKKTKIKKSSLPFHTVA
jgi:uncharacterized membrane protein